MTRPHYIGDLRYRSSLPKDAKEGDVYFVKTMDAYYIYEDKRWQSIKEDWRW